MSIKQFLDSLTPSIMHDYPAAKMIEYFGARFYEQLYESNVLVPSKVSKKFTLLFEEKGIIYEMTIYHLTKPNCYLFSSDYIAIDENHERLAHYYHLFATKKGTLQTFPFLHYVFSLPRYRLKTVFLSA